MEVLRFGIGLLWGWVWCYVRTERGALVYIYIGLIKLTNPTRFYGSTKLFSQIK